MVGGQVGNGPRRLRDSSPQLLWAPQQWHREESRLGEVTQAQQFVGQQRAQTQRTGGFYNDRTQVYEFKRL